MRDISPSQREVLERAASHVKIYERLPKGAKKEIKDLYSKGCFDCVHSVGKMDSEKQYVTIEITSMDDDYYEFPGDQGMWSRVAFVASRNDVFWSKNPSPFKNFLDSGGMWPSIYKFYHQVDMLAVNPAVYARLLSVGGAPAQHVNTRFDILEYFKERGVSLNAEVVVSVTPSTYNIGAYVDPSFALTGIDQIPQEAIHLSTAHHVVTPILNDVYGAQDADINLARIYSKERKPSEKPTLKKKISTQTGPPTINWAEALDDAVAGYTFDPFEQGHS